MPRRVLRALVCAALLSSLASTVLGHSALESATPGPGDRVTGSPTVLVAQFSQNLDPTRTSLEVRDASGARIVRGGEPGKSPREFRLDLPELLPGEYEVRWTSYSTEDSEVGRDSYTFEVIPSPTPSPTPTATRSAAPAPSTSQAPTPSPTPAPSTASASPDQGSGLPSGVDGSVAIPIVVALAAVGAFGLWAFRRPRT